MVDLLDIAENIFCIQCRNILCKSILAGGSFGHNEMLIIWLFT